MSTLTKICVVVLVVLVLFACPIFIQHALTGPNWRQAYLNEQALLYARRREGPKRGAGRGRLEEPVSR